MKKNGFMTRYWREHKKLFQIMRLTIVLIITCLITLQANVLTYSQSTRLSIKLENATIRQVFDEIEKSSEYIFVYSNDLIALDNNVNINIKDYTIDKILEKLFESTNNSYEIIDRQIVIKEKLLSNISSKILQNEIPSEILQQISISGKITEITGDPMPGVNIRVEGTTVGVVSDAGGKYTINVPSVESILTFSFIGFVTEKVTVGNRKVIDLKMAPDITNLEDVTVVAFAKQKKNSVIASITTIKPSELKVPSSNLTTALAGRMAGIISYQRSGEPGKDNAQFFIRGVTTFGYKSSPLILIDGIELTTEDLARLQTDDIASFSIMKDAAATALYGARGANGVIYVTTKEGVEGPAKFSVRFENSISSPTQKLKLADPITYMKMHNESVRTRMGRDQNGNVIFSEPLPYSQEKIDKTISGVDPVLYPTTDWYKMLFNDQTSNQRFNFNVNGGGKIVRYYIAGTVNNNNGNLKTDSKNNFNNNISLKQYQLNSKVNINLTPTTKIVFNFKTTIDNYTGPLDGGSDIYNKVMRTNPVLFKPFYEADADNKYTSHVLFGNDSKAKRFYLNPYADMVKGYKEYKESRVLAQIEINQDLSSIVEGLSLKVTGNGNQYSYFDIKRQSSPYYYKPFINPETGDYTLTSLNPETGEEYLSYEEGDKKVSTSYYVESLLNYTKIFDKHQIGGMLVGTMRDELKGNSGSLQKSLPYRNLGLAGRFTYGFMDKYFFEGNFGYNGSERFSKSHRFGFFPSAGLGWVVSNEKFFESFKTAITKLKLRATYGLVGNDAIGNEDDRFFYLSQVNMKDPANSYTFGKFFDYTKTGVSYSRYANDQISWEIAKKMNLGLELGLFDKATLQVDVFQEKRSNILMDRVTLANMGLQAGVRANMGEAQAKGIDISLNYNTTIGHNWWIQVMSNFTYAVSKITKKEEPDYSATPWRSAVGYSIKQNWGYIAERLFVDDNEVANSPSQDFGVKPMGGDIKYRDINGDDKITPKDMVPIGFPTDPEIVYGFGFSFGYKTIDFSAFFQGLARESFWIDTYKTGPFIDYHKDGNDDITRIHNNQLLQSWADSYWSEENRNVYASFPRLSNTVVPNNMQNSTWFMQNGAFIRLKSIEIGYSLPQNWIKKIRLSKCRFYANGVNLLTFSKFKLWDPEMGGDGLGYPIQKVINAGVTIDF